MQSRKIAITGGIGSGKSVLCEILREMGYPVFSCDEISHTLWSEAEYRKELATLFPSCADGDEIDRASLTALVFRDKSARKRLEEFSHPRIMQRLLAQMNRCEVSFAEVPLLYEGGYDALFDGAIALVREDSARIDAVAKRDRCTAESVKARIAAQISATDVKKKGCYVIENNGSREDLRTATEKALLYFNISKKSY